MQQEWASVTNLAKVFDIGRTKTTALVHQMEQDPEYDGMVISFSHKKKTINIAAFQDFLVKKVHNQWLS